MPRGRRSPIEALAPYLVEAPHPRSPHWRDAQRTPPALDWLSLFGNRQPVEIEVGFGKGMFLIHSSLARPDVNFFGIEIERPYVLFTAARLAKHHVANVRLVCTDARWLLGGVADGTVQAVHVYFPDPWWKKRHHKRKLLTPEFTAQVARILAPGGALHFVTDVQEYFDETCAILAEQNLLTRADVIDPSAKDESFLTHFDRKYRAEGRPTYRARFVK